ncbi:MULTISPECIES: hypothetical protein [unclassified Micromonospora]|nr:MULTISPECIES: hypothetical protein [unclassified Micromonospora]MCZ7421658.1 hypothetical protein [Verrucosispora sp. WMMA2121]WBB93663.1 hypothetical protein O7597_12160 [Verrucosispora sp. WMMC514]
MTIRRAAMPGRKVFETERVSLALGEFVDPQAQRLAEIATEESR